MIKSFTDKTMIRLANNNDIDKIIEIYHQAKAFMDNNGNSTQWVNNYPQKELLYDDIKNKNLYVYIDEDDIFAVFCYFVGEEPTYKKIYDGNWLNENEYGVIHRIAVNLYGKGIASKCIQWCFEQCKNLRIDTHPNNIPMQKTILKNGFTHCGTIKKEDGSIRLAYQKTIL